MIKFIKLILIKLQWCYTLMLQGEDLIEVSSQLIYQGEAVRVTTGMWTNNITLFLFDHQLVYCKKDILKRNTYVYKGRIYLDTSEVIDVPDGKVIDDLFIDHQLGVTVRHCLKVYSCVRDKWLLFCCRTAEEKRRWLAAMAEERRLVAQDRNDGLEFPSAARQLARLAATRQQNRPPIKPRKKYVYKPRLDETIDITKWKRIPCEKFERSERKR
ncbi:hypothetical protein E2986_13783 [Frieseomelitta varia]|uniref:PH domain-containing protein n=1 Tax=Frieseomelitta varia TaxID=561572 RepID=A0A833RRF6_9HYME|nr:hypothetical protein E2986_13783 [Frieseomelitta varia]